MAVAVMPAWIKEPRTSRAAFRDMQVVPTLDDLPADKANCLTCTRKGARCPRTDKTNHNGYIRTVNGEIGGMIAGCINYTGPYKK